MATGRTFGASGIRGADLGLALLSALLLVLAFPKAAERLLAWVGIVPVLFALAGLGSVRRAFVLGWIWGFAFYLGGIYWIVFTLRVYGHLPLWVSLVALLLLAALLAVYHGIFAAVARRALDLFPGAFYPVLLAATWVMLEHARSFVLSGFPWMSLGYSQAGHLGLVQVADVSGFYGVSALVVLANATLFHIARQRRRLAPVAVVVEVAVLLGFAGATLAYGGWRLAQAPDEPTGGGGGVRVSLLQGNIDQDRKWDEDFQNATLDIYEALAREGAPQGTDLVVLPETAAPFYFQQGGPLAQRVRRIARERGQWTLFGAPAYRVRYEERREIVESLNRAYLLDPAGEVAGQYDKLHLVPFGEYSPIPFLGKVVPGQGNFRPGEGPVVLSHPKGRFGVLICYEAIFPDLTRRFVRDGASFLVNITNDAWFGRTSSPRQHIEMAALRAIENRVWLVRAANTGITAAIDPWGRVTQATGLFETAHVSAWIEPRAPSSFYTRHGDVFAWGCWGFALGGILYGVARRGGPGQAATDGMIPLGDPF